MLRFRRFLNLIVFVFFFPLFSFSQVNQIIDSLNSHLDHSKEDSVRINLYISAADKFISIKEKENSTELISQANRLALKTGDSLLIMKVLICSARWNYNVIEDFYASLEQHLQGLSFFLRTKNHREAIQAYYGAGKCQFVLREVEQAKIYVDSAISLSEQLGDIPSLAKAYNLRGLISKNSLEQPQAIGYFDQALDLSRGLGDQIMVPMILKNLGSLYHLMGFLSQSFKYYQESLEIYRLQTDTIALADNLHKLGRIYSAMKNRDKSMEYMLQAFELREKVNAHSFFIGESLQAIGSEYYDRGNYKVCMDYLLLALEKFDQVDRGSQMFGCYLTIAKTMTAMKNYEMALSYCNKATYIGKDTISYHNSNYISCYMMYASIYKEMGNYKLAMENCLIVVQEAEKLNVTSKVKDGYKLLSELYYYRGDYELAYSTYIKYTIAKDTLLERKKLKDLQLQQILYDVRTKNKEIKQLIEEKEIEQINSLIEIKRQKTYRNVVVGVGLFLAVILILIYSQYKLKHRANLMLQSKNQQIEDQNTQILDSITYAKRIQDAILTSKQYMDEVLGNYFVYYQPKDIVSGDFYWVYQLDTDRVMVAVADCTGHGVPGAFMSMIGNSLLNEIIIENGSTVVNEVLDSMRTHIIKTLDHGDEKGQPKDGMDITLLEIDKSRRKVKIASAGHRLFLYRDGECHDYKGDSYPVGSYFGKEQPFNMQEIDVKRGDILYLTTDGYSDQFGGPNHKKFGIAGFRSLILKSNRVPLRDQSKIYEKAHLDWKGSNSQIDDLCVMGIEIS